MISRVKRILNILENKKKTFSGEFRLKKKKLMKSLNIKRDQVLDR